MLFGKNAGIGIIFYTGNTGKERKGRRKSWVVVFCEIVRGFLELHFLFLYQRSESS